MSDVVEAKNSRNGKKPVAIPSGVQVTVESGSVRFKGPKGELQTPLHESVAVEQVNNELLVKLVPGAAKVGAQYQGLVRSLMQNAAKGVSDGYKTSLDLVGVGYRAELKGSDLTMSLGLSHQVKYTLPEGVKAKTEIIDQGGTKLPRVHLESHDKALLGRVASRIKSFRPPEPYKGKGVRFTGERIREKAGKAGAKG